MARFRALFWLVVLLGVLPSLLSGVWLLGQVRVESLCGQPGAGQIAPLWIRLHEWGRVGAPAAALLVIAYALVLPRERRPLSLALGGLLVLALAVAGWSAHVTPWQALSPVPSSMDAESGGAQYCLQHLDELRRLRFIYWLHAASGLLAAGFTLALTEAAARWRKATSAR